MFAQFAAQGFAGDAGYAVSAKLAEKSKIAKRNEVSIKATKGKECFEMASKVTVMMFAIMAMAMAGQLACSSQ